MFDTSEVKKRLLHSVAELIEARETCIAVTTQLRKLGTRKERVDDISDLLMNLLDKVFHEVENELARISHRV